MIQLNGRNYHVVQASIYGLTLESKCGKTLAWSWEYVRRVHPELAREHG